jgi:hypothetical protein
MTFFEVINQAIADFLKHGFDDVNRLEHWLLQIKLSAHKHLMSEQEMQQKMEKALKVAFNRLVTKDGLVSKEVSKYDVTRLSGKLRAELDRRIIASANLIKDDREQSIRMVLRRFEGWATSIPAGGTKIKPTPKEKSVIKKGMSDIAFKQRRVIIDQTHKLIANINEIVAVDNGAIAARWHSHWKQMNYDYRKDHKDRDDKIYIIRDSWAVKEGYIDPINGYTDDITSPGEEVFCRCNYVYLYNLRQVKDLLTKKGLMALQSPKNT